MRSPMKIKKKKKKKKNVNWICPNGPLIILIKMVFMRHKVWKQDQNGLKSEVEEKY